MIRLSFKLGLLGDREMTTNRMEGAPASEFRVSVQHTLERATSKADL